ncbi:filamentous hemagglutinin N-terminal domain-containing protein [Gloeocapsa sp. BRSZ]
MIDRNQVSFWLLLTKLFLLAGVIGKVLCIAPASAQIVPDEIGNEKTIVTSLDSAPIDLITGGATRGINLFHSFQEFNVDAARGVYFENPQGIENILSRVTGKNPSRILGLLGVQGEANLYLINPNGIIFGSQAILNVQGSFVATTANAVQFGNQGIFNTSNPTAVPLLSINPSAFLFNQLIPNSFIYQAASFLLVPENNSLIFLGGNVTIDGGALLAPSGRVEVGGLAVEGKVELTINGSNLNLSFPTNVARADVLLTNAAGISVAGEGGGSIAVNARDIDLLGTSALLAGIQPELGSVDTQAGDITLDATGQVTLGEFSLIGNFVSPNSTGSGGNIYIKTSALSVTEGTQISTATFGQGDAGSIEINARDTVNIAGFNEGYSSGIFSTINANGNAGNISVKTTDLFLVDGAQLVANTFGKGNAGSIFVQANNVSLDNASGILSSVSSGAVGDGGDIQIQTRSLSLTNGSQVQALIFREQGEIPGGQGKGGNITINATESVDLIGISSVQLPIINPLNDSEFIATEGFSSGIFTSTEKGAMGSGGNIAIDTRSLQIRDGAIVNAQTLNSSDGGQITINTNKFTATDGGQVLTVSRDRGKAGNITLNATDSVTLSGSDPSFFERFERFGRDVVNNEGAGSGLFASTDADSTGNGGTISLATRNLLVSDRAKISAQSLGTGIAGNISIRADESVSANDGEITTSTRQSVGGAIDIVAGDIRLWDDSHIRTNVASGNGGGGNIALSANSILLFDDSDILAFARDGQGGNITLNTPVFFAENFQPAAFNINPDNLDGNNRADINASGAVAGVVEIPDVSFIQNSLIDLPENPLNTDTLIANSCVARNPQQGNFLITGAGSLPSRPGDSVSAYPTGSVQSIPDRTSSLPWRLGDPIVEPQGVYRLANGRLLLSRECLRSPDNNS